MKEKLMIAMFCLISAVTFAKTSKKEIKFKTINRIALMRATCTQTVIVTYALPNGEVIHQTETYTATSSDGTMLCSLARAMATMAGENKIKAFLSAPAGPGLYYGEE